MPRAELNVLASVTDQATAQLQRLRGEVWMLSRVASSGASGLTRYDVAMSGLMAGGMLTAVAAGIFGIAKAGTAFNSKILEVVNNTTVAREAFGNIDSVVNRLSKSVLDMSTELGAAAEDVAMGWMHAYNLAGKMNFADIITKVGTKSAVANFASVEQTVNILANTMHAYALDTSKAATEQQRLADVQMNALVVMGQMDRAAAAGNMTVEQFNAAAGRSIAVGANLGIGLAQISAGFVALTKHGYSAAQAQTQMTNLMQRLANPTAAATKEIKALSNASGVNLVKVFSAAYLAANGLSNTSGTGALQMIYKAYRAMGYSAAQATQESYKLINAQRGGQALAVLLGTGYADYNDALAMLSDREAMAAVNEEQFAEVTANTGWQVNKATTTIENIAKALGDGMGPAIVAVLRPINSLLDGVYQFAQNNKFLAGTITAILGVAAGFLGVLMTIGATVTLLGPIFNAGASALAYFTGGLAGFAREGGRATVGAGLLGGASVRLAGGLRIAAEALLLGAALAGALARGLATVGGVLAGVASGLGLVAQTSTRMSGALGAASGVVGTLSAKLGGLASWLAKAASSQIKQADQAVAAATAQAKAELAKEAAYQREVAQVARVMALEDQASQQALRQAESKIRAQERESAATERSVKAQTAAVLAANNVAKATAAAAPGMAALYARTVYTEEAMAALIEALLAVPKALYPISPVANRISVAMTMLAEGFQRVRAGAAGQAAAAGEVGAAASKMAAVEARVAATEAEVAAAARAVAEAMVGEAAAERSAAVAAEAETIASDRAARAEELQAAAARQVAESTAFEASAMKLAIAPAVAHAAVLRVLGGVMAAVGALARVAAIGFGALRLALATAATVTSLAGKALAFLGSVVGTLARGALGAAGALARLVGIQRAGASVAYDFARAEAEANLAMANAGGSAQKSAGLFGMLGGLLGKLMGPLLTVLLFAPMIADAYNSDFLGIKSLFASLSGIRPPEPEVDTSKMTKKQLKAYQDAQKKKIEDQKKWAESERKLDAEAAKNPLGAFAIGRAWDKVKRSIDAVIAPGAPLRGIWDWLKNAGDKALPLVVAGIDAFGKALGAVRGVIVGLAQSLVPVAGAIWNTISKIVEPIGWLIDTVLDPTAVGSQMKLGNLLAQIIDPATAYSIIGFLAGLKQTLADVGNYLDLFSGNSALAYKALDRLPEIVKPVALAIGFLGRILGGFGSAFGELTRGEISLDQFFGKIGDLFKIYGPKIWEQITKLFAMIPWAKIWAVVWKLAGLAFNFALDVGGKIWAWLVRTFKAIDWAAVWSFVSTAASNAFTWLVGAASTIYNWICEQLGLVNWEAVWRTFNTVAGKAFDFAVDAVGVITSWLAGEFSKIKWDKVWEKVTVVGDFLGGLLAKLFSPGTKIDNRKAGGGIQIDADSLVTVDEGIGHKVIAWLQRIWPDESGWAQIWNGVSRTAEAAFTWTVDAVGKLTDWLGQQLGAVDWGRVIASAGDIVSKIWEALFSGGTQVPNKRKGGVQIDPSEMITVNEGLVPRLLKQIDNLLWQAANAIENDPTAIPGAKQLGYSLAGAIDGVFNPKEGAPTPESGFSKFMGVGEKLGAAFITGILNYINGDEAQGLMSDAITKIKIGLLLDITDFVTSLGPAGIQDPNVRKRNAASSVYALMGNDPHTKALIDAVLKRRQEIQDKIDAALAQQRKEQAQKEEEESRKAAEESMIAARAKWDEELKLYIDPQTGRRFTEEEWKKALGFTMGVLQPAKGNTGTTQSAYYQLGVAMMGDISLGMSGAAMTAMGEVGNYIAIALSPEQLGAYAIGQSIGQRIADGIRDGLSGTPIAVNSQGQGAFGGGGTVVNQNVTLNVQGSDASAEEWRSALIQTLRDGVAPYLTQGAF